MTEGPPGSLAQLAPFQSSQLRLYNSREEPSGLAEKNMPMFAVSLNFPTNRSITLRNLRKMRPVQVESGLPPSARGHPTPSGQREIEIASALGG